MLIPAWLKETSRTACLSLCRVYEYSSRPGIVRVEKVRTGQPPLGLRAQVKVIGAVPEAAQAHRVIERLGGGAKIGNYLAGPELAAPLEADLDGLHGAK